LANLSPKVRTWVRAAVDYGGLVVFLIGFLVTRDVVQATWWLVAGSAAGLILGFAVERRVAPMPLLAGAAALIFGGLTLIFHDDRFIKMKPTFVNLAFAVFLLGGTVLRRNPLKLLMGEALRMSDGAWRTLTWRYGLYFLCIAVLNEVVWRNVPNGVWVFFRFPGLLLLALAFSLTQTPLIMRGMKQAEDEAEVLKDEDQPPPVAPV
jgi:intracellular septation protein